jgi:hydroxyacylglutathione hydrolase
MLVAGCAGEERVRTSQDRLMASIEAGTAPAIIDVRTGGEYREGHVPGAVHIPVQSLWSRANEVPAAKHDPVVVYCLHGPRAGMAKFALWTKGFDNVTYLDGHMSAWRDRGLPMNTGNPP